ncbi:MAG: hypothetical protein LUH54_00810, partial [Firmicutes bacterium]|nr:hypothetical protein [Bacillota bacterium]
RLPRTGPCRCRCRSVSSAPPSAEAAAVQQFAAAEVPRFAVPMSEAVPEALPALPAECRRQCRKRLHQST